MTRGLMRFQKEDDLHFVTFSCYKRLSYLGSASARDCFVQALERMRLKYAIAVAGYVVMPEHVHLLLGEPPDGLLANVLQRLKLSVAKTLPESPFWTVRYYDFNVFARDKATETLKYMHRNPVKRGIVCLLRSGAGRVIGKVCWRNRVRSQSIRVMLRESRHLRLPP